MGAVKGAADLEAKLSEVKAVSGATAAEMVLLRRAAEDAGATTKYTATEAADALGNLTRAGLSAKDAITALPPVLQLAQAGGIDLARASEYVTKTIMGMGLAFTDAGRVADVLAMGANASNTSVDGLAQALSYAAPLAKTLGLSLETTVAIIGKFADAGIDASRAGTALNAIMAQFADPASKFRTELAGAGITTTNFEQAIRQLAAAGPVGSKAINAVGTEAGPALRALLNQGIGALDELKGKLDGAAGSAAKTAAIMEGNLNGAFNGLSSAWDTVKNALATPVLPVLTNGVQSLSKAFQDAVSSGIVGKFGESIATAFDGAIKWTKEFLAQADFGALAVKMQAFAADTQSTFTKISEAATNAGNVFRLVYGVMSAGANGALTAIYGLGVAVSGVVEGAQRALAWLYEGMAKFTFGTISEGYKQLAADVRLSAEATSAASRAMADKAFESFTAMADGAQTARNGWSGLTNATQGAAQQASATSPVLKSMADSLAGVGTAATDAGIKAKDSADKQQAAAIATKERVAALHAEYEAAIDTGNWQLAAEKLQSLANAASAAKTSTEAARKQAEEDAAAIAAAFERMGIKTKDQLSTAAKTAKEDFDRIKESGQATADGLRDAFKKYAEAAIAANGGVASETIKSEAAMRGLQITTDAAGKSIVSAMDTGKAATEGLTGAVNESSAALRKQKEEADASALALKKQAEQQAQLAALGDAATNEYNSPRATLLRKLNDGALSSDDMAQAQAVFTAAKNNLEVMQQAAGGVFSVEGVQSAITKYNEARRIFEAVTNLQAPQPGKDQAKTPAPPPHATPLAEPPSPRVQPAPAPTPTPAPQQASLRPAPQQEYGKVYTVILNIEGRNTAINTSSDADARTLVAALQRAQRSAGM